MKFAVIQLGHTIFGLGATEQEAWDDAQQWLDPEQLNEIVPAHRAVHGDLVLVPYEGDAQ